MASFCKTPCLVTGHGGDVGELNHSVFRLLKKRCLQKASAVTVVSAHLSAILQKQYGYDTAQIIPMGCNTGYLPRPAGLRIIFHRAVERSSCLSDVWQKKKASPT